MKADSWATATNRWVRAADLFIGDVQPPNDAAPRVAAGVSAFTARGFRHGYDVGDGPDCGRWWNLDGGKHGGGVAGGNHAHHRYADRI